MKELPRDKDKILDIFRRYKFHDEYEHPLENCVEFQALVDFYCEKPVDNTGFNSLVRNGCPTPPRDAGICPYCGYCVDEYRREELNLPEEEKWEIGGLYSFLKGHANEEPLMPTFKCPKCKAIWQWLPMPPKEEKSQDKPEMTEGESGSKPEKDGTHDAGELCAETVRDLKIPDDLLAKNKKPWYQRFIDYFTLK